MPAEAYRLILLASLAGGGLGALVLWNRWSTRVHGRRALRGFAVVAAGTVATVVAILSFAKAFDAYPAVNAAMVVMLSTGWVAVLHSVVPLPLPRSVLCVRAGEFALLESRWSGVRAIGYILRSAPLRGLGGQVYMDGLKGNVNALLPGLYSAETVHLWALLVCCPWFVVWGAQGHWTSLASGVSVNVLINVYPVLHLRYVTGRIGRHGLKRRGRRPGGTDGDCPAQPNRSLCP